MKIKVPYAVVGIANFEQGTTTTKTFFAWNGKINKQAISEKVGKVPFQVLKKGNITIEATFEDFNSDFNNRILEAIANDNGENANNEED